MRSELSLFIEPFLFAFTDEITALAFSSDGHCLATGDRSGKLRLLKVESSATKEKEHMTLKPYFQCQSHVLEFDFLKSSDIDPKINKIRFLNPVGRKQLVLSCNGKYESKCSNVFFSLCIFVFLINDDYRCDVLHSLVQTKQSSSGKWDKPILPTIALLRKRTKARAN
jgi:WD40 repeat protein